MSQLIMALTSPTFAELELELKILPPEIAVIEWRRDLFRENSHESEAIDLLKQIGRPLIYTLRSHREGGEFDGSFEDQTRMLAVALASEVFTYVDLEINDESFDKLLAQVKATDVKLIVSHHSPVFTPELKKFLYLKKKMAAVNPAIVKFATFINKASDLAVIKEAGFTERYTEQIMIGMGEIGVATRLFPEKFASEYSFVAGKKAAAPGQVTMDVMTTFLD